MSLSRRHKLIGLGFKAIALSRADRGLGLFTRGRGVILTFHHVRPQRSDPFRPNALLEITPAFLDRTIALIGRLGFDIVRLDEVEERLARPRRRPFVCLTFDDGYRDNVRYAQPILRRHGCPWTMFIACDYAAGHGRLWWIELEEAIRRLDVIRLHVDGAERLVPASTVTEKREAFALAYATLRRGPESTLRATIAGWCREAGIVSDVLVRSLCLDWDEIRALAADPSVSIGAHTISHPMLAKQERDAAAAEIDMSRREISSRINRVVRHFSYPVGDPSSAGPREFQIAHAAGYSTAVTTRPGHLHAGHAAHLTALPRVSINGLYQTDDAVRALLSGLPFLVWNRGRRLNVS